jgi:ABC-type transporter MlaC component
MGPSATISSTPAKKGIHGRCAMELKKYPTRLRVPMIAWCFLVGIMPSHLFAETPTEALQTTIDRLQNVLHDPNLGEDIRAKQVWETIVARFDMREMSKHILGSYWEQPVEKQDAFTAEFTAFIKRTFSDKIEKIKDAILICRDDKIQGSVAKVKMSLYMSGDEFKIKFHMRQHESEWKIYDVMLDNGSFSLVSSYRTQLQWILQTASFEELLQVIREKNAW